MQRFALTSYFPSPGALWVFPLLDLSPLTRLSPQSRTSVLKQPLPLPSPPPLSWFLHPWDSGQRPTTPYHARPWHLKPLGRGTPKFPWLCVSPHTIRGAVTWGLRLSSSLQEERTIWLSVSFISDVVLFDSAVFVVSYQFVSKMRIKKRGS